MCVFDFGFDVFLCLMFVCVCVCVVCLMRSMFVVWVLFVNRFGLFVFVLVCSVLVGLTIVCVWLRAVCFVCDGFDRLCCLFV